MASLLRRPDATDEHDQPKHDQRMKGFRPARPLLFAALLAALLPAGPAVSHSAAQPGYEMGFRNVTNLHADLFLALDKKKRQQVSPQTILLTAVRLPCLASQPSGDSRAPVQVSAGCIDFLNRVAHAKAIDQAESGFFVSYTAQVARQARSAPVPDFDTRAARSAWDLNTMNRQASHFNQMAAALVAIDLAHHYLGHYRKHAPEFASASAFPLPISAMLTEAEWRDAVMRGARNALDCGLGVDGLRAVFECFDQMPSRPAWAAYFIHPKAKAAKINTELNRLEREFFAMNHQLQKMDSSGTLGFPR